MKYCRQCSITGQGMDEGYLVNDTTYIKDKKDLLKHLREFNFISAEGENVNDFSDEDFLEWCYNDEVYFWTDWEDDYQYEEINGVLVEI